MFCTRQPASGQIHRALQAKSCLALLPACLRWLVHIKGYCDNVDENLHLLHWSLGNTCQVGEHFNLRTMEI